MADVRRVMERRRVIQDGVKKVKVGSHREQKSGILNGVKGFFGAKSAFKEVNDYEWVDDVEYRPTYDYVPVMKEIVEEIPVKKSAKK